MPDESAPPSGGLEITPGDISPSQPGAAPGGNPMFGLQASGQTPKTEAQVTTTSIIPEDAQVGDQGETARSYADKFTSVDDLEAGYKSLESKLGERSQQGTMDIDQLLASMELDTAQVNANWAADGRLTDEQYAKFANGGWSRFIVDQYMNGQIAIARNGQYAQEGMLRNAQNLCGGEDEWQGLRRWAAMNVPEERLTELNKRLGEPAHYEGAIKEMLWDYRIATGAGSGGSLLSGQAMPNTSAGFADSNEMVNELRRVKDQGYVDAAFKKRMANTAPHVVQGVDR